MLFKVTCFKKINFREHINVSDDDEMPQQITSNGNVTAGCALNIELIQVQQHHDKHILLMS